MRTYFVSRHPAALEFLRREFEADLDDGMEVIETSSLTPEEAAGAVLYGVVPLSLAALAMRVGVIEFDTPPRGGEYTLADMDAAGARIVEYRVMKLGTPRQDVPEPVIDRPGPHGKAVARR